MASKAPVYTRCSHAESSAAGLGTVLVGAAAPNPAGRALSRPSLEARFAVCFAA